MKYSTILLGAFATLGLVHAFAAPEAYPGGFDDETDFSDEFTDCEESGPVSSLIPISSKPVVAPPSVTTTTTTTTKKGHHHHHHHHSFPVITKTVIIIVETFTRFCPGPTTISEGTVTVTVTEPTTITFSHGGPFTRTKTILECFTTTTEFFFEDECGCKGWPFATGKDFPPLVIPSTAIPTGTTYPKPPVVTPPKPAGAPAGTGAVVFTGIGSKTTSGFFAVVAGVVAIMVL